MYIMQVRKGLQGNLLVASHARFFFSESQNFFDRAEKNLARKK